MPQYFKSFIEGMRSVADLQYARDENNRKNAQQAMLEQEAANTRQANQRAYQLQADMNRIITGQEPGSQDPSLSPDAILPPDTSPQNVPYGDAQAAESEVSDTEQRVERLRSLGSLMISSGQPKEGRLMLDQAIDEEKSLLDRKIKRMEVSEKEKDYVSSIAQGVSDQESFTSALITLMKNGYPVDSMMRATGGVYSPQAQQMIDGLIHEAMTAKQSSDTDIAIAKDVRQIRNARERMAVKDKQRKQQSRRMALKRNNIEEEEEEEEVEEVEEGWKTYTPTPMKRTVNQRRAEREAKQDADPNWGTDEQFEKRFKQDPDIPPDWEPPPGLNRSALTRPKLEKAAAKAGVSYTELLSRLGLL